MARVFPPKVPGAVKRQILPHPGGRGRAKLLHRKALSSYLLFFFTLLLTLTWLDNRFPGVLGFATDISSSDILNLTNRERTERGLPPLKLNSRLMEAAEAKARDMFLDNYWAHVAPDGTEPWDFIDEAGYVYISAGENLAKDFSRSSSVVKAWMNSPSHRDNILNPKFEDIGIAVVNGELGGSETTLVVQMFGRSRASYLASIGQSAQTTVAPMAKKTTKAAVAGETAEKSKPSAAPIAEESEQVPTEMTPVSEAPHPLIQTEALARAPESGPLERLSLGGFVFSSVVLFSLFLVFLLVLDIIVVSRRRGLRFTHHTLVHLALLILLLFGVWYSQVGTIL